MGKYAESKKNVWVEGTYEGPTEAIEITGVAAETPEAVLLDLWGYKIWVPKSQLEHAEAEEAIISEIWARMEDLV